MTGLARSAVPAPLASLMLLGACATQPPYQRPPLAAPDTWVEPPSTAAPTVVDREDWWTLLRDPAVDALAAAALADNPTLAEAAARIDQARAARTVAGAAQLPVATISGGVTRAKDRAGPGGDTIGQTAASIGIGLSWEVDLWGRVREGRRAADHRLAARTADAEAARLSVIGDIADTVPALRACHRILAIRDADIASRETELAISRVRLGFGAAAPVVVAAADSNLASARTERIGQAESCRRLANALVALSGADARAVLAMVQANVPPQAPPVFAPALPATILLSHPAVAGAEREVAARWSDIAVARAARLPRLDLSAALTGQWIRALGAETTGAIHSLGAGASAPLFDGGAGAGAVRGAEAAYREAIARRDGVVRGAVRDIEDGLAAQQSAIARTATAEQALTAARATLDANEARWRAGSIPQYELEESRRQLNRAEESAVTAAADRVRAWVALVRRTGAGWSETR